MAPKNAYPSFLLVNPFTLSPSPFPFPFDPIAPASAAPPAPAAAAPVVVVALEYRSLCCARSATNGCGCGFERLGRIDRRRLFVKGQPFYHILRTIRLELCFLGDGHQTRVAPRRRWAHPMVAWIIPDDRPSEDEAAAPDPPRERAVQAKIPRPPPPLRQCEAMVIATPETTPASTPNLPPPPPLTAFPPIERLLPPPAESTCPPERHPRPPVPIPVPVPIAVTTLPPPGDAPHPMTEASAVMMLWRYSGQSLARAPRCGVCLCADVCPRSERPRM
jgi:hypothetical protein